MNGYDVVLFYFAYPFRKIQTHILKQKLQIITCGSSIILSICDNTISSFTGQNFGGKEFERIRGGTKMACIMAVLSALLLGMVLFFFSDLLAKIMLTGQEAAACASIYLRFLALFMVLLNALFVFRSCVQGLGKPAVPTCSGIDEMLIRIPAVYFGLPVFGFAAAIYSLDRSIGAQWYFIYMFSEKIRKAWLLIESCFHNLCRMYK